MLTETIQVLVIDEWANLGVNLTMAIIAFVSAVYACLAYNHQRDRSKKDAACKLAEYYASVILEEHGFISNVYSVVGLDSYIRNMIDINSVCDFDDAELSTILNNREIDRSEFMRKLDDIDPFVILKCRLIRARTSDIRTSTYAEFAYHDNDGTAHIKNEAYLKMDFRQDIDDLLNQLEYFCMSCRYGVSDEEILYQSLHQTFISLIWILYPTISKRNTSNEDKMYTNIIWLFLKWRTRLSEIKQQAKRKRENMERKAKAAKVKAERKQAKAHIAQEEATRAQERADATKADVFSGKGLK